MPDTIEPPAQDDRWEDPIEPTSPPAGGWTNSARRDLVRDAASTMGLSIDDAEALLEEYSPGQLRTLVDERWRTDR